MSAEECGEHGSSVAIAASPERINLANCRLSFTELLGSPIRGV
jgi:hypothetical protein